MEGYKHFSHPHNLKFHKSLEGAQLKCTGCNFPCTGTPVYSCRACKYFLHEQCFNATRSLEHPSHPNHPLSLFPISTHTNGSFKCDSCHEAGSGFCYSCANCDFDLHVHCAYNDLKPKTRAIPLPNKIQVKSHPNHELQYQPKPPDNREVWCDLCGTRCDANDELYNCKICEYDAHVECVNLPESVKREDHEHTLSLLHMNTYPTYECDVCRGAIAQSNCMYLCEPCDYGMHIKCVTAKVSEKAPMDAMAFQVEMFKLQNQMKLHQMAMDTRFLGTLGFYPNRHYRY